MQGLGPALPVKCTRSLELQQSLPALLSWHQQSLGQDIVQSTKRPRYDACMPPICGSACARSLIREVPFDPHLEHLFNGEEILFSARAWTHGAGPPALKCPETFPTLLATLPHSVLECRTCLLGWSLVA